MSLAIVVSEVAKTTKLLLFIRDFILLPNSISIMALWSTAFPIVLMEVRYIKQVYQWLTKLAVMIQTLSL